MSDGEDRVQQALAAYLEHRELGGPAPDLSELSPLERRRLDDLIALLDQTEGVAFGRGRDEPTAAATATTEIGARVLATLREDLPAMARIANDSAGSAGIAGIDAAESWIVGTFGGRVRVWLLAGDAALEPDDDTLRRLERVFRLLPDTAAVALVDAQLSCLVVAPEDCAPNIQVPHGTLVARRYRRPVSPVGEALDAFIRDANPSWEPIGDLDEGVRITVDVAPIAQDLAAAAVADQVAAGARARKTNPKRTALTELGDAEAGELANLVVAVHEGRTPAADIDEHLRRLAARR